MFEIEDDAVGGGFGVTPSQSLYRAELNDPQVANAGQTHAIFELNHSFCFWNTYLTHGKTRQ